MRTRSITSINIQAQRNAIHISLGIRWRTSISLNIRVRIMEIALDSSTSKKTQAVSISQLVIEIQQNL